MWMWSVVFFILICVYMCYCLNDTNSLNEPRKKHHHYDKMIYGGGLLYYLTFILVKIKIAFAIGAFIVIALLGGKLFAALKLLEHNKYHAVEPVQHYPEPHHHHHLDVVNDEDFVGYSPVMQY